MSIQKWLDKLASKQARKQERKEYLASNRIKDYQVLSEILDMVKTIYDSQKIEPKCIYSTGNQSLHSITLHNLKGGLSLNESSYGYGTPDYSLYCFQKESDGHHITFSISNYIGCGAEIIYNPDEMLRTKKPKNQPRTLAHIHRTLSLYAKLHKIEVCNLININKYLKDAKADQKALAAKPNLATR
ncbi:MAG: hypothetical protein LBM38_05865 [Clostridiales bacterium]|jgi:hypothetical protein|nr:hypothetical protein [Clostridiales bacterium]